MENKKVVKKNQKKTDQENLLQASFDYNGKSLDELKLIRKIEQEKNRREQNPVDSFMIKLIIVLILVCILVTIIVSSVLISKNHNQKNSNSVEMRVESTLTSCQELVSYKYRYQQMDFIKHSASSSWTSYVLLKYSGILRAGIKDLNQCTFEMSDDKKNLKIFTPEIEILGNEISSYEVLDEYQRWFSALTVKETMEELDRKKLQLEKEAVQNGLLKEAADHAKLTLEKMFLAAGFERVQVVYPPIDISPYINKADEENISAE